MPSILKYKENCNLESHCLPAWERDARVHAAVFRHRVEKPDLRKLDSKMTEKNELRALPLFSDSGDFLVLDLVFVEIGDSIDDNPGDASAEVDNLMHDEAQDSGREDIILHVLVPALGGVLAFEMWRSAR
jgi:hypothetical protein